MLSFLPLTRALGLLLLFTLSRHALDARCSPAPYSYPAGILSRATVDFAESSSLVPEGSGRVDIEVVVAAVASLDGEARVKVADASTAV